MHPDPFSSQSWPASFEGNQYVEHFNATLTDMIAKTTEKHGHDWDCHLPYLLYAYRISVRSSTRESPFFLLYGCDSKLLSEEALSQPLTPYMVDIDDYKTELVTGLTDEWKLAGEHIKEAQKRQKHQYDRRSKELDLTIGDRVMIYMPQEKKGNSRKVARPYFDLYHVLNVTPSSVEVCLVVIINQWNHLSLCPWTWFMLAIRIWEMYLGLVK